MSTRNKVKSSSECQGGNETIENKWAPIESWLHFRFMAYSKSGIQWPGKDKFGYGNDCGL